MSGGHGGRRAGAGRPSGSGWKPAIIKMRAVSAEQKAQIIGSDRDPMRFLVDMVWDESVDLQTRLSAAAIVVPYLHPRLSATQVHKDVGDPNTAVLILSTDPIEAAQTYQRLISGD